MRRDQVGFVFQALQPDPDAERAREHHAADRPRRPEARPGVGRHGRRAPSASATGSSTGRASSRAASSSASRWPAPSPRKPAIIFADEPTGNLDSRAGAEILGFMQQAVTDLGQTIVMVTHDPVAAAYADRVRVPRRRPHRRRDARPHRRADPRPHEGPRGRLMLKVTLRSLWEHKRRLVFTIVVDRARRGVHGRHVRARRHPRPVLRRPLRRRQREGRRRRCRARSCSATRFGGGDQRAALARGLRRRRSPASTASASAEPYVITLGFGSSNRVLDAEGEPIGAAQGPPTLLESWIDDERPHARTRVDGRARARGRRRDRPQRRRRRGRRARGRRHGHASSPSSGSKEYDARRHGLFGTAKSSAGAVVGRVHPRRGAAPRRHRRPDQPGRGRGRRRRQPAGARRPDQRRCCPTTSRSITGEEAAAAAVVRRAVGLRVLHDHAPGVRRHRAARRRSSSSPTRSRSSWPQRTRELALLRAVGASRGQVLRLGAARGASWSASSPPLLGLVVGIAAWPRASSRRSRPRRRPARRHARRRPATVLIALVVGLGRHPDRRADPGDPRHPGAAARRAARRRHRPLRRVEGPHRASASLVAAARRP